MSIQQLGQQAGHVAAAAPAPVNRKVVFAIVAMTLLMMTVDSTIVATVVSDCPTPTVSIRTTS